MNKKEFEEKCISEYHEDSGISFISFYSMTVSDPIYIDKEQYKDFFYAKMMPNYSKTAISCRTRNGEEEFYVFENIGYRLYKTRAAFPTFQEAVNYTLLIQ